MPIKLKAKHVPTSCKGAPTTALRTSSGSMSAVATRHQPSPSPANRRSTFRLVGVAPCQRTSQSSRLLACCRCSVGEAAALEPAAAAAARWWEQPALRPGCCCCHRHEAAAAVCCTRRGATLGPHARGTAGARPAAWAGCAASIVKSIDHLAHEREREMPVQPHPAAAQRRQRCHRSGSAGVTGRVGSRAKPVLDGSCGGQVTTGMRPQSR